MNLKKILFIQHASGFGGSAMSLLYTLQGLKNQAGDQYEFLVALAKWNESLSDFYEKAGFRVIKPNWIDTYEHTQGAFNKLWNPVHVIREFKQIRNLFKAKRNTAALIELVKPDIIHLNSVVLLGSALAAKKSKTPLVWHVREPSVKGFFGLRRFVIRHFLGTLSNSSIFICNADKASWGNPKNGTVVYNFIDFEIFDKNISKPEAIKEILIPKGDLIVLFLGGFTKIKGGIYLIKAMNNLVKKYPNRKIHLLFPGGIYQKPDYLLYRIAQKLLPFFGLGTHVQLIEKEMAKCSNQETFVKFPFVKDIARLFLVSDVLVFPSIRPHFARPVIEAGAMGKPVIGSKLGGVEELIKDGENGFYIKPKSAQEIEERLEYLLNNRQEMNRLGNNGYEIASKKYQARLNIQQIIEIYTKL